MVNREIIRIKIVQLTYAYYQNGDNLLDNAEKELFVSLSKSYTLYHYLLALIVAVTDEAARRFFIKEAQAQREGGPEPSSRFINNRFALQLKENVQLADYMEKTSPRPSDAPEFVGRLLETIESSPMYAEYMAAESTDYEADRELWRKLYRLFIQENEELDALLEELSIYWNDDKNVVDTFVLKTIKRFDERQGKDQELLPEFDSDDERSYARQLFRATILNADEYQRYMRDAVRNWDFSRLAYMDVIIMQIALAEMLTCPSIPLNVTINEYVELAKYYSTSRSAGYINGMLDHIARHLIDSGKLMKQIEDKPQKQQ